MEAQQAEQENQDLSSFNGDLDYLVETYILKEDWHSTKLSPVSAYAYFKKMLDAGNIAILRHNDKPVGYLSVWFINNDQTARILNRQPFHAADENITDGDIVFVANAFIDERYRNEGNINKLKEMMKEKHKTRDYAGIIFQNGYNKDEFSFYRKGEI